MALRTLQKDLDKLFEFIFTGKGEGNKAFRALIGQPSHTFTVKAQTTYKDLISHAERPGKGKTKQEVFRGQEGLLEQFCKELVNYYITAIHQHPDYRRGAVDVISFVRNSHITIKVYHKTDPNAAAEGVSKSPYNWISDIRTLYGNTVIHSNTEYETLFNMSKKFSQGMGGKRAGEGKYDPNNLEAGGFSQVAQVGHAREHAVSMAAGGAWAASVGAQDLALIDGISGSKGTLQSAFGRMQTDIAKLGINLEHFRHLVINPTSPQIKDSMVVLTNLEGEFANQAQAATEKDIKAKLKAIAQVFQDECKAYYTQLKAKGYTDRATSEPFITQFKNLIIFSSPGIRRLLKSRVGKKVGGKVTLPKSIRKRQTKPRIKDVPLSRNRNAGDISGVGDLEKGKKRGSSMQDTRFNMANLPGLINAKLGATILDNMGNPALENRTGKFANSAKVMAAFPGPSGTQIDYTYDKNPYEVFEMGGRGREPWATAGRDPRTIIDKSIREIAVEMAMGALITRRA